MEAVRLCYDRSASSAVDPDPEERRACYFDYKVTDSEEVARDANSGTENYRRAKTSLGKSRRWEDWLGRLLRGTL